MTLHKHLILKRLFRFSQVLAWTCVFIIGISAFAEDFSGTISRTDHSIFLSCATGCTDKVEVRALTADSQKTLNRLQDSDFMEGSGGLINGSIVLDSVSFVGLANLIGTWQSGHHWIQFRDFNTAVLYLDPEVITGKTSSVEYSIVPGETNSWRVLFSTSTAVTSAHLSLNGNFLKLQVFDPNTGISQTYPLSKIPFVQNDVSSIHP